MEREMNIQNANEVQNKINHDQQHQPNPFLSSSLSQLTSLTDQTTTDQREILDETNHKNHPLDCNTEWIKQDLNQMKQAQTGFSQNASSFHPLQVSPKMEGNIGGVQQNPDSLNNIHENLYESHIGQFRDKMQYIQHSESMNSQSSLEQFLQFPQHSNFCTCLNEYQTHPPLQSANYFYISADNQQLYQPDPFIDSHQNHLSEFYQEYMKQNNQKQPNENSPLGSFNCKVNEEIINENNYKPLEYFMAESQEEMQYNENQPNFQSPQQSSNQRRQLYQMNKEIQAKSYSQVKPIEDINNYPTIFAEQSFDNSYYQKIVQSHDGINNQVKDADYTACQLNSAFEDDSHSKSQLSDEQFLMNFSQPECTQSSHQYEQIFQKQQLNAPLQNNQIIEYREIQGQYELLNQQYKLTFEKKNRDDMENQGELEVMEKDIFQGQNKDNYNYDNNNINNQSKNEIISLDLCQEKSTDSNQIKEQPLIKLNVTELNDAKDKVSHEQFQSLLKIFFPSQKKVNKEDQEPEAVEIFQIDKKNIVRNLIRAFIRYFLNKTAFPQIHQQYFLTQNQNETKQQFKKYFTKKKFNNHVVKQLVIHSSYGGIFKQFLQNEAINYLQHSNVKCKENHQKFILFLLKCYDNQDLLENLETYIKSKRL